MPDELLEGRCLCGALEYRVSGPVLGAVYCHCRMCQRSTGAPVTAWAAVLPDQLVFSKGTAAVYQSSAAAKRLFCGHCGAQIVCRHDDEPYIVFTLATLADPAKIAPSLHIWTASQIPWLDIHDSLPRRTRGTGDGE